MSLICRGLGVSPLIARGLGVSFVEGPGDVLADCLGAEVIGLLPGPEAIQIQVAVAELAAIAAPGAGLTSAAPGAGATASTGGPGAKSS